jgi:hypothetical protein
VAAALRPSRPSAKRPCQPLFVTALAIVCCCAAFLVLCTFSRGGMLGPTGAAATTTTSSSGHVLSAIQRLRCAQLGSSSNGSSSNTTDAGCKVKQQRLLRGILRAAALDPSLWRPWDAAQPYQPVYGSWQLFQRTRETEGSAAAAIRNAVPPGLRHQPRGTKWIVAVAPVWPPSDLATWSSLKDWNTVVVS